MFVTHLDYDEWDAEVLRPGYLHREMAHPDWEQIEATIRALDGGAPTDVVLRASNENPADTPAYDALCASIPINPACDRLR